MSRRNTRNSARRLGAGIAAIAIGGVFLPTGSQALAAADDDVDVVNTETVKVYLTADGKVDTKRVYEQLEMTGDGDVQFSNPIETSGLRNLDGFEDFDVEDGEQQVDMSVDGVERLRTVSDYSGDLPLEVDVEYKLDGESVDAEDIAGEDGDLEVTYTVKNVTAKPQEITYPDGRGGIITETAEVPIPMVGSLSTVLPSKFTQVESEQANMAGDGKGGTKMSFTMTLVPPIGSDTATFGYTAQIEDGEVPPASISALPVNPLESPTFKTAATSYKGGAKTGATLTAGAVEIDSNLLKIRDGAGDAARRPDPAQRWRRRAVGRPRRQGCSRCAEAGRSARGDLARIGLKAGVAADGAGKLDEGAASSTTERISSPEAGEPCGPEGRRALDRRAWAGARRVCLKVAAGVATLYTGVGAVSQRPPRYQALNAGVATRWLRALERQQLRALSLTGWISCRSKLGAEAVPGIQQMMGGVDCATVNQQPPLTTAPVTLTTHASSTSSR